MSNIFDTESQNELKFYMFKFHDTFHGLIGLDTLKILRANLDFDKGALNAPNIKVELYYHKTNNQIHAISIAPRMQQVIKIKTSINNGDVIIPYHKIGKCEIPNC